MVSKSKSRLTHAHKSDPRRLAEKVRQATELADKSLGRYGLPEISLAELRILLNGQLKGISLSEVILRDREARP